MFGTKSSHIRFVMKIEAKMVKTFRLGYIFMVEYLSWNSKTKTLSVRRNFKVKFFIALHNFLSKSHIGRLK